MTRLYIFVAVLCLFFPSIGAVARQPESTLEIKLDAPGSRTTESEIESATPPLPPNSLANTAFAKIGNGKEPGIKGASAILVDAETGQILYSRKPHYRRPVASTTKIMTALLVLEHCDLDDTVTASNSACEVPYTSIHLVPGEQLTARDLLTGMLIRSANDAAHAFAEYISGSVPQFSELMNRRASQLGLKDTHFKNPHGLYAEGAYSTAYDLSVIAREAIKNDTFNQIVATRSTTIKRSKNTQDVVMHARSPFMKYEGADGIKSGYIKQAGYCYVGSATRGGWRLLCVVLKSDNASADAMALMDYGFDNFKRVTLSPATQEYPVKVSGGKEKILIATPASDVHVVVAKGLAQKSESKVTLEKLRAPIEKGQQVGTITAYVDGALIMSTALIAKNDIAKSLVATAWFWFRWPFLLIVSVSAVGAGTRRRSVRGRTPAKNTLRRRRRFSQAVRTVDHGR